MRHPYCGDVNRLQYIMNTTLRHCHRKRLYTVDIRIENRLKNNFPVLNMMGFTKGTIEFFFIIFYN